MYVYLYFDMLNFGVKNDGVCENGFLEIYDGLDDFFYEFGMYCGELKFSKIIFRINQLMIKVVFKFEGENIGWFFLRYELFVRSVCGSQKFICVNRQCVKSYVICNGEKECDDGFDEEDCSKIEEFGFFFWYRFWFVSIIGGMLIVGVWFWRVWKKIVVVRFEGDEYYIIILLLSDIEMVLCIAVEFFKFLSYSEVVG